jgi:subtilisin family serine protease
MKKTIYPFIFIFLLFGTVLPTSGASTSFDSQASGLDILRGERPPVNWEKVPEDAFEPSIIQVKFNTRMTNNLPEALMESKTNEAIRLGNNAVDELNQRFGVTRYKSLIHDVYNISQQSTGFAHRHRQWGLHLWYELRIDNRQDVLAAVEAFNRLPEVEIAEPVLVKQLIEPVSATPLREASDETNRMSPNDQYYGLQYGFKNTGQDINGVPGTPGADISAEPAWEYITGNPDVIVAVIDGGIQYNHPDLAANIWPGIGPDGTNTMADDHGTHVAGTIAAVTNNEIGVAGAAGGNGTPESGVKLMSLDLFNGSHGLNTLGMNIYAADNGAAISQNSWGYGSPGVYNQSDLDGIDYFNAHGGGNILGGGLTIFAAGNSNDDGQWYPAYYSGSMAVASTDNRDQKSSFSNYGSWIDLAAPGTDIASTGSGSSYLWMSGTSMACPHVSGVAALVLAYAPGVMTNLDLWTLLVATTDNIESQNPNHAGLLGSGRLNALLAIEAAQAFLGAVDRPASLTAAALSENEIALQWQTNAANNAVLVAFSENDTFGTPADGTVYNAGQSISGGGTVLYYGQTQNAFNHTGLDFASTYYYRAWSYDGIEYSGHIATQATTFPPDNFPLPFTENFDDTSGIPLGWSTSGTSQWAVGTFSNGLTGTTGNYAWTEMSGNNARTAHLVSPNLVFSNFTDIRLEFKHRYNHERSSAILAYSLNDGGSWTTIQTWTGNTGTTTFDQVLPALAGQPNVMFRWTLAFEGGGPPSRSRSWSIDDVSVTGTSAGTTYTIAASAGAGGSISPSGNVTVSEGSNQTFTIAANNGFEIADVLVDGISVGAVSEYTFTNVSADHSIAASFVEVPVITYTINASAGTGGSISPSGTITVVEGDNQSFSITPNNGFVITDVVVDANSVGAVTAYTFNNVTADHTIHAAFETAPEDPCLITTLPYLQDFDAAAAIPECWESVINAGDVVWQAGTFNGGLSGTSGNYAYFFYQGNRERNADLISPPFDFSNYTGINLAFTHYHVASRSSVGLYYSTDGGNNWTTIQTWSNSTANPAGFSQNLAALAGQPNVIFRWNMDYPGGGPPSNARSWSVDDIVVSGTLAQGAQQASFPAGIDDVTSKESLQMSSFPNPAQDQLNISFSRDISSGTIIISNITGSIMHRETVNDLTANQSISINTSYFNNGLFIVRLIADDESVSNVISVQK